MSVVVSAAVAAAAAFKVLTLPTGSRWRLPCEGALIGAVLWHALAEMALYQGCVS